MNVSTGEEPLGLSECSGSLPVTAAAECLNLNRGGLAAALGLWKLLLEKSLPGSAGPGLKMRGLHSEGLQCSSPSCPEAEPFERVDQRVLTLTSPGV